MQSQAIRDWTAASPIIDQQVSEGYPKLRLTHFTKSAMVSLSFV